MSLGQRDQTRSQTGVLQAACQQPPSLLASLVRILIKGDVDATAGLVAKLGPLCGGQMSADGGGGVAKSELPKHSEVKQAFDEDHGRKGADRLPGKQAAL